MIGVSWGRPLDLAASSVLAAVCGLRQGVEVKSARRWRRSVGLVLLLGVVGACAESPASNDEKATPPSNELSASAGQFRFDEGTRNVRTGLTNNSTKPITVTTARISWDGFKWSTAKLPKGPVLPDQTAAFLSHFGRADCTATPSGPRLRAVVNGVRRDLPLRLDQPGLFERLRTSACAAQRLTDAASLTLSIGRSVVRDNGVPFFTGTVTVLRRQVPGEPIAVVDLGGSILFNVLPREGRRLRPVSLPPGTESLTIPIRVGPTRECSPHSRRQHLAAVPVQRLHPHGRRPGAPEHQGAEQDDPAAVVEAARPLLRHRLFTLTHLTLDILRAGARLRE